jgi:uncharacterized protein (TIGR03437 family)
MKLLIHCAAMALSCTGALSQTTSVTLASQGYRMPTPLLDAAPGQVIVLHVYGVTVTSPGNTVAERNAAGEYPKVLKGISVDLVQGNPAKTTSLPIQAMYQTICAQPGDCAPLTGITLQIPFELETQPGAGKSPALRISANGKLVGGVAIRAVTDNVHVLNTCDDTQTYISAAYSIPQDLCAPVVMVNNKLNSLYNLARGGDSLALWAYGLGAKTEQKTPCCNSPEEFSNPVHPVTLNFDYRVNAPASRAVPGFGQTADPFFAAYVNGGMYQVNFTLPATPAGLPACDGVTVKSNLTVTVTGSNSQDAAQLCVAP